MKLWDLSNTQKYWEDFCRTLQIFSEDIVLAYLKKYKSCDNLCISGGIGLNGYINQKIINEKIYKHIHIPPACSDCGLGIGAALLLYNKMEADEKRLVYRELMYCGNDYTVNRKLVEKIIDWYQGASESGPRALGNRSIIADPRFPDMKADISIIVKKPLGYDLQALGKVMYALRTLHLASHFPALPIAEVRTNGLG